MICDQEDDFDTTGVSEGITLSLNKSKMKKIKFLANF